MAEKKTLNLDTFNDILFSAFKDQSPRAKAELLAHELSMAYNIKIQHMEQVIQDLNEGLPYHKDLDMVNAVDANCDRLYRSLEQLEKEHPEILDQKEEDKQNEN